MLIKNLECNSADNAVDLSFNRQAMSNPEGSREELTTTSRVDGTTTTPLRLSDVPLELILRIASQLRVSLGPLGIEEDEFKT